MWFTRKSKVLASCIILGAASAAALFAWPPKAKVVQSNAADLVVVNGNIRTLDAKQPRAEALAVNGGRISAIGSNDEIRKHIGPATEVIDAKGRLVLPGFNDSHVHFTAIGNQFSHLDLREVRTREQIIQRVKEYVEIVPRGRWIIGAGIPEDVQFENTAVLDAVSPATPVLLYYSIPKRAAVNAAALKAGRLNNEKAVVADDEMTWVRSAVPRDHATNWAEIAETASNLAASLGVTTVQDVHSDDLAELMNSLDRQGKLKTRIYDCIGIEKYREAIARGLKAGSGNSMVRGGCVKGMTEGAEDEIEELTPIVTAADKAGIQVALHAIGGRSVSGALTIFENAAKANGIGDRRFRVEHAARLRNADIPRFARGVFIASMQPFLFYGGPEYGDDYAAMSAAGVKLAFGSDASMIDLNPMLGIHAAVNSGRRSVSVEEAVRAYTVGSAYAEFAENEKGTLAVGKLADLAIHSDDIFTIDRVRIKDVRTLLTVVNGRVVFRAG
ncbi:MAG: amidohydrolase [Acidobacteria bacterium]|nr:amidohydrolase [Acidobacteriota bacterium]